MKRILFAALALLVAAPSAFTQKQTGHSTGAEAEVAKLDRQYFDAYLANDAAAVGKFEDEGIVIINPDGTTSTRQQDVGSLKSGELKFTGGSYDEAQVRVFGDAAVVTGRITVKGTYKGQDIAGSYRFTDVFARRGGHWVVVASQSTMIPPPK